MRKWTLITLLLFTNTYCTYSQTERIENKFMECWYDAFEEDKLKAKQSIVNYENFLIKEGVLEDNSAKSYTKLLQDFAEHNKSVEKPSKPFYLEIQKLKKTNVVFIFFFQTN